MRVLITGATGLVGQAFLQLFGNRFSEVYVLGRTPIEKYQFVKWDLDDNCCPTLPDVDFIVHLAAQTSVNIAYENFYKDFNINASATVNLLNQLAKKAKKPFFIYIGTATQVGYTGEVRRYNELEPDQPCTFYDLSKLIAEQYVLQTTAQNILHGCSLRLCNVYGELNYQTQKADRGIIDRAMGLALQGEPLLIYGDGQYARDYIHVYDVATAIFKTVENFENVIGKKMLVGTGEHITLENAFKLVRRLAAEVIGYNVEMSYVQLPSDINMINKRQFIADCRLLQKNTSWSHKYSLESGLRLSYGI